MVSATAIGDRSAAATPLATELRGGPGYWFHTYLLMVRWELLNQRLLLPMMVVLQILLGAGMALGFGLLIDDPTPTEAAFLATGATVFPMMTLGLTMLPQVVADQKLNGTYEYVFGLPVPRMAMYFAGLTVWSVVGLPSAAVALGVAAWRFEIDLAISPFVLLAAFLVISVASAIGYAIGHGVSNPRMTNVITQVLIFVVILFSPVSFPAERLPGWLQATHEWLPPEHAANVMRGTLTDGLVEGSLVPSFAVLTVWALGSWALTAWVITRRR